MVGKSFNPKITIVMKTMVFIGKVLLSVACATGMACIAIMNDWRGSAVVGMFMFGGILIALLLGAFDIEEPIHLNLRDGARSMHRAA